MEGGRERGNEIEGERNQSRERNQEIEMEVKR